MIKGENREINLGGRRVVYLLRTSSRGRNLRITIKPGGSVFAVKPRHLSESAVQKFLVEKSAWILKKIDNLQNKQSLLLSGNRADYKRHVETARQLALRKISQFNQIYKINFNRLAIRDQSTRWGSCSRKGNLNFNYRIALLPEHLADYIVVHEMCHLRELNHSPRFWDLVAVALPDYARRRKELRNDY
jgi:predicted metal-dependent hydrolase